ncbi:MAG: Coenzyme F420 hydrogenase/dehydrogenase, beta subunit C-terminal domain [Planctomycetaceae bacterium]|jgi:coenzyme F420 hydrogenase subunit beta|nr:Coenzyme F420 hydrogenase/dehydrogenase, beta subunit C-terminal domain [Planctomycetaceae bacterium]
MNINFTIKNNLCTGCGVCENACPTKSIKMIVKNGRFMPVVSEATCTNKKGCRRCFDACPGHSVPLNEIAKNCFNSHETKTDEKIGRYLGCFTGYSTDYDIRYHCASGGMLSQFLIWLLEKKHIDGAVVTKFSRENELLVESFVATTKEEILSAKSSKYSPVTLNHAIQNIKSREGKYIIVGLPCHIHGFRKYEKMDGKFCEKIAGYFGLYCSGGRTFYLTEYIFKERNIIKKELAYFAYRDEGCLGSLVAGGISGTTLKPFRVAERFQQYYHPLRSFFKPRRCLQCIDHFAELADISFGDIHIEPYSQDTVGVNSVIVRNPQFLKWLHEASADGCMEIKPLEEQKLIESQFQKRQKNTLFLKLEKLCRRKTPQYDVELKNKITVKSIFSYFFTLTQIFIGKHKILWFMIFLLKKKPPIE